MANTKKIIEPTPSGGDYVVISFFDEYGNPADEKDAAKCIIQEYFNDGTLIFETFSG